MIIQNNIALTILLIRRLLQEKRLEQYKTELYPDPNVEARDKLLFYQEFVQIPAESIVLIIFLILMWNGTSDKKLYAPKVVIFMTIISFIDIVVHIIGCILVKNFSGY